MATIRKLGNLRSQSVRWPRREKKSRGEFVEGAPLSQELARTRGSAKGEAIAAAGSTGGLARRENFLEGKNVATTVVGCPWSKNRQIQSEAAASRARGNTNVLEGLLRKGQTVTSQALGSSERQPARARMGRRAWCERYAPLFRRREGRNEALGLIIHTESIFASRFAKLEIIHAGHGEEGGVVG